MKADKDLTVEYELSEELETVVVSFADGSMTETSLEQDLRRIQRAAFEKGAKAQRREDIAYLVNHTISGGGALIDAPLVEFEEEEG